MIVDELVGDMDARFIKLLGEITNLGKETNQNEICLKVLRGLPSHLDMTDITMRDHRDIWTLQTGKLFNDLKTYKFEMKTKYEEDKEDKTIALIVEPSNISRSIDNFFKKKN